MLKSVAPLLVWSYLGLSEKQSVALDLSLGEKMSMRNHTPRGGMFCWIPRALVQRGGGDEDNRANAARAATSPDAGAMGNSRVSGL